MNKEFKVYIADDHTLFRKAMVNLLKTFESVADVKDAENGRVWCTDCHSSDLNFANMPKQRMPQHDELEKNHEFMVELMTKWVARLNSDEFRAKAKLKQPVQCLTCHETDPRKR